MSRIWKVNSLVILLCFSLSGHALGQDEIQEVVSLSDSIGPVIDSLEKEAFSLQPEELADIWTMIEKHDEAEKEAIRMAEEAKKNCPLVIQRQLLEYLVEDEKKHDRLMGNLENFKRNIYPYA